MISNHIHVDLTLDVFLSFLLINKIPTTNPYLCFVCSLICSLLWTTFWLVCSNAFNRAQRTPNPEDLLFRAGRSGNWWCRRPPRRPFCSLPRPRHLLFTLIAIAIVHYFHLKLKSSNYQNLCFRVRSNCQRCHSYRLSIPAAAVLASSGVCSNPEDPVLRFRYPRTKLWETRPSNGPIGPDWKH